MRRLAITFASVLLLTLLPSQFDVSEAAPILTNPTPLVEYRGSGISSSGMTDSTGLMNASFYNSPSVSNGVVTFNGSNQYAITNSNLSGSFSSLGAGLERNVSIFVYIYPMADGTIVDELSSTTQSGGWHDTQIELAGGTLKFRVWSCSGVSSSIPITLNTWNYVGFTYNYSTTTLTAYVNGTQAGQNTSCSRQTPWNDGSSSLFYGLGTSSTTNLGSGANGNFKLAQFDLFSTPLTSSQVTSAYNATTSNFNPLATPSAPTVTAIGATTATVADTAVANASSYLISRFANDGTTLLETKTATSAAIATGTTFTGLSPSSTYVMKVTAIGDGVNYGNSALGAGTTFTTANGATSLTLALSGGGTTATYRQSILLIASVSNPGYVTFYFKGRRIPGCIKILSTAGAATCNWKPSVHGQIYITAQLNPTGAGYNPSSSTSPLLTINARANTR